MFPTAAVAIATLESQYGPRAAQWTYEDAASQPVGVIVRWNRDGSKIIRPVARTETGWIIGAMPRPRPLYRRSRLQAAKRAILVEGEKTAGAFEEIGLLATTSPHGAQAAETADWSPLAGIEVPFFPDNDAAGQQYVESVLDCLAKLQPPPVVKIIPLPGLPAGGDFFDYLQMRRVAGLTDEQIRQEVEELIAAAPVETLATPQTETFVPFPVDALPARLRVFVEAVAQATGTEPAFAALAALVVIAGCIGNRVAALVKSGWVEPAVLWGVLIGRSGATKSPVLKLVTRALIELFKVERRAFRDALQEYQREAERHDVHLSEWKKSQRKGPPTDPPAEPERPAERRVLVSDITIEKLGELLEQNPLGLLLLRDELAGWIGAFDRYASGGKGSDQPAWLSMYDAAPITIDRKSGKGNSFIERAAVSVLGSIQPGTLTRSFGKAEREAGLLARVLVAYPPDQPGLWTEAALPDEVANAWRELLAALLALSGGVDEQGDPRPRLLPVSPEAKPLWIAWHDRHAQELVEIGSDDLAAHFAKLKGTCVRVALLFACVEVAAGGQAAAAISADMMRRAIVVIEWFKKEARRAYQLVGETDEQRGNRQLVEWIERRGGQVTVRDLTHGLYRYRGRSHEAKAVLDALAQAGLGRWQHPAPGTQGGRAVSHFVLHTTIPITKTPADGVENRGFGDGDAGAPATW